MKKKQEVATLPAQDTPVAEPVKKRGRPAKTAEVAKVEPKTVKATAQPKAKTVKEDKPKAKKPTAKKNVPAKAEPAVVVEQQEVEQKPVVEQKVAEQKPVVEKKKITLNQEFNVLIGFLAIALLCVLCVTFQTGSEKLSGWELILNSGLYSGVFKGLMVFYVITLFIDCALAVRIDSENKILNTVEEVLYAITLTANIIVGAVLFTLIKKIGLGLIIFGILSLVSVVVKLARIYTKQN